MLRTEISKDDPLYPGDRIEMRFKFIGPNWHILHAAELALLEYKLKRKNPYWHLRGWDAVSVPDKLILLYEIKEPSEGETPQVYQASVAGIVTGAIIAATVIGGGVFMWLSFEAIYKITESPAGKIAVAGTGAAGIAVLIIAVILAISYYRRE